MRIKVTSHLATLNHFELDLGILKRQQALVKYSCEKRSLNMQTARKLAILSACGIGFCLYPALAQTPDSEIQSPIDVVASDAVVSDLPDLVFNYAPATALNLVNTGAPDPETTIRADICPACGGVVVPGVAHGPSTLTIGEITYELLQFHLHAPAEHEFDGLIREMELHLVHKAADGALAVVGQTIGIGAENTVLAPYFDALTALAGGATEVEVPEFALAGLIPDDLSSYRYTGSLTAPNASNPQEPYFAPVAWTVLAAPTTVSEAQYQAFLALFAEDVDQDGRPDGNAREQQPLNDRQVLTDVVPAP